MRATKLIALFGATLIFAAWASAQENIPTGTILPVLLDSTISLKSKPGSRISARIMQDVPLMYSEKIREGAKVIGHIVAVTPASNGTDAQVSFRFDQLLISKRTIPITTNLRAVASLTEVEDAQLPISGPDRGTSPNAWTTTQIGGDVVYRGGGKVRRDGLVVGEPVADGVLGRLYSDPTGPCRNDEGENHRRQALWVFSAGACGPYGFRDLTIRHWGRGNPIGEIAVSKAGGALEIHSGSGMLLRVIDTNKNTEAATTS
jgi:hypothetical protein